MKKLIYMVLCLPFLLTACNSFEKKPELATTLATFNLRLAPKPDSSISYMWQDRKDSVGRLVLAHNFDIFGTQEGFKHQLDYIAKTTGYKYFGAGRDDGKSGGEHAAIFYNPARFEVLDSGDFWFAETPDKPVKGWDAMCKRVCTWGKFRDKLTGAQLYFFSLHFDHVGKVARTESAKLLLKKAREIAKGAPAVCVGDFNALESDEPMKIILSDGLLLDSRKLSKTQPYGPNGTYHNFTGTPLFDRIDYILTTKGIDILSYEVVSDKACGFDAKKRANPKAKIPEYPSDHFPVAVRAIIK